MVTFYTQFFRELGFVFYEQPFSDDSLRLAPTSSGKITFPAGANPGSNPFRILKYEFRCLHPEELEEREVFIRYHPGVQPSSEVPLSRIPLTWGVAKW